MSSNLWPESAEQAGLPAAESFQSANLNGISLGSEGEIRIAYADSVQAGASLSLLPSVNASTGEVLWACLSQGFVDLRLPPLGCQAKPSER